jgi:hypothetical protein
LTTVFDRCGRPELSALAERDRNAKLHQQERDSFPRPLNPSMIQKIRQQIRNGEEIPDKGFQKTWGDDEK